jgi:hypothetical protein
MPARRDARPIGLEVTVTKTQAEALRVKWKQQGAPPACEHPNQELAMHETGYLTGDFHCTACGELVAANTRDPFQVI